MSKKESLAIISIFLVIILGGFWANKKNFALIFRKYNYNQIESWNQISSTIENEINNNFFLKSNLSNLYGLSQKMLSKNLVGNFEYIKDNKGILHLYQEDLSADNFIKGMSWLKEKTKEKEIPLLYVQIPDRVIEGFIKDSWAVEKTSKEKTINQILDAVREQGISNLDLREDLIEKKFEYDNFFFRTDIHLTTQAEWYILKKIIYKLEELGCSFYNQEEILNLNHYEKINNKFLGNFGRMTGKYFTQLDVFERYYPKFETNYTRTHMITDEKFEGSFEEIVMNGYPKQGRETIYWVTDYMQFTNPFYNFENHLSKNDTNILLIMDSFGFRTAAYLSLLVKNLSIIDTRYQGRYNMTDWALQLFDYDAVVVLQSTFLLSTEFMPVILKNPNAEIVSVTTPSVVKEGELYEIEITVRNIGQEAWKEEDQVRLCIFQDGVDYGFRIKLPENIEVLPGDEYTFIQKDFYILDKNSTFLEYQMVQEGITYFGEKYGVTITIEKN